MGHHNRHFSGDPRASAGFWGTPNSSANFCEEDYAVTLYIAEFINTFTNLAYIWFALLYPRKDDPTGKAGTFDVMGVAMLVLGVNSFLFHATMLQSTQFCDEFAMFVLGGSLLQGIYTINRSSTAKTAIITLIWASIAGLSALYLKTGDILHHVYSFNTMILLVGLRTLYLILLHGRPAVEVKDFLQQFGAAVCILVVAYTVWQLDLEKCAELRQLRSAIGLPWAWLLELHGWWHVLTAWGAIRFIRLIRALSS